MRKTTKRMRAGNTRKRTKTVRRKVTRRRTTVKSVVPTQPMVGTIDTPTDNPAALDPSKF